MKNEKLQMNTSACGATIVRSPQANGRRNETYPVQIPALFAIFTLQFSFSLLCFLPGAYTLHFALAPCPLPLERLRKSKLNLSLVQSINRGRRVQRFRFCGIKKSDGLSRTHNRPRARRRAGLQSKTHAHVWLQRTRRFCAFTSSIKLP